MGNASKRRTLLALGTARADGRLGRARSNKQAGVSHAFKEWCRWGSGPAAIVGSNKPASNNVGGKLRAGSAMHASPEQSDCLW